MYLSASEVAVSTMGRYNKCSTFYLLAVLNGPTSKARDGKGRGGERGTEGKVKESEGETRWREGFGPPKNLGVAPPMLLT